MTQLRKLLITAGLTLGLAGLVACSKPGKPKIEHSQTTAANVDLDKDGDKDRVTARYLGGTQIELVVYENTGKGVLANMQVLGTYRITDPKNVTLRAYDSTCDGLPEIWFHTPKAITKDNRYLLHSHLFENRSKMRFTPWGRGSGTRSKCGEKEFYK